MKQRTETRHASGNGRRRCVQTFNHGIRRVVHDNYYADSWTSYLIIPRAALIEGIRRRFRGAQYHDCDWWTLIPGIDRWVRPAGYGGPGQPFASEPTRIDSSRRFMVIAQSGGLDI